jgi:hypothetical protein
VARGEGPEFKPQHHERKGGREKEGRKLLLFLFLSKLTFPQGYRYDTILFAHYNLNSIKSINTIMPIVLSITAN